MLLAATTKSSNNRKKKRKCCYQEGPQDTSDDDYNPQEPQEDISQLERDLSESIGLIDKSKEMDLLSIASNTQDNTSELPDDEAEIEALDNRSTTSSGKGKGRGKNTRSKTTARSPPPPPPPKRPKAAEANPESTTIDVDKLKYYKILESATRKILARRAESDAKRQNKGRTAEEAETSIERDPNYDPERPFKDLDPDSTTWIKEVQVIRNNVVIDSNVRDALIDQDVEGYFHTLKNLGYVRNVRSCSYGLHDYYGGSFFRVWDLGTSGDYNSSNQASTVISGTYGLKIGFTQETAFNYKLLVLAERPSLLTIDKKGKTGITTLG